MNERSVLVTGGSGFIAVHCILQLLERGHRVRTTVRSAGREADVRAMLREGGVEPHDRLAWVTADLSDDAGWRDAATGCDYVLHGASPTPSTMQGDDEAWIAPARDGTLRVLRASRAAGVKRVVLTSAFSAIGCGHGPRDEPFDEEDWTDPGGEVAPYQKSKTVAERAAWAFVADEGDGLELAAIHPVAVLGPVLGPDYSHSIRLVKGLLDGEAMCPRINSGFVDVRDVADLHVRAMTDPAAAGERFLAISGNSLWMIDVADVLRRTMGAIGSKVPTRETPDSQVRDAADLAPALRNVVHQLGRVMNATSEKATRLLGWDPRPVEEAIVATAESLARLGLLDRA